MGDKKSGYEGALTISSSLATEAPRQGERQEEEGLLRELLEKDKKRELERVEREMNGCLVCELSTTATF